MKAKVIRTFRDKYTKALCRKGRELEVSEERFREINSTEHGSFLEVAEIENPLPPGGKASGEEPTEGKVPFEELPEEKNPGEKVEMTEKNLPEQSAVSTEVTPVRESSEEEEPMIKAESAEENLPEQPDLNTKEVPIPEKAARTETPKKRGKKEGD